MERDRSNSVIQACRVVHNTLKGGKTFQNSTNAIMLPSFNVYNLASSREQIRRNKQQTVSGYLWVMELWEDFHL